MNRKSALDRRRRTRKSRKQDGRRAKDADFFRSICGDIHDDQLIPIIGDTVRNEHIFDVNFDHFLGIDEEVDEDENSDGLEEEEVKDENARNITERLAELWADEEDVGYPLADRYRMARVAQFLSLKIGDFRAKENYLDFQRRLLLDIARDIAEMEEDDEGLDLIDKLERQRELNFAEMAAEVEFPRFPDGKKDPLHILAELPLSIYITTGYYDSMERALRRVPGKEPRTQVCLWNMEPSNVAPEHRPDPKYTPTIENPLVYHLFGYEKYPTSMVLSEDDYLKFLWKLARDELDQSGNRILPAELEAELRQSSLLLLGYRLQDWDFRVLFRGLLAAHPEFAEQRRPSVAIQLDPKEQPDVPNLKEAHFHLNRYFDKANFRVKLGNSDDFIATLKRAWQQWIAGDQT